MRGNLERYGWLWIHTPLQNVFQHNYLTHLYMYNCDFLLYVLLLVAAYGYVFCIYVYLSIWCLVALKPLDILHVY